MICKNTDSNGNRTNDISHDEQEHYPCATLQMAPSYGAPMTHHSYARFVASDSWGIKQSVVLGLEHLLAGAITIAPHVREEKAYITFFRKLSPAGFTFLEEYWEYLGCTENFELKYFGECFDYINYTLKQESYVPFVIDAVRVLARAISKYISDECGDKEFHRCSLSTSRFQGDRLQKYYRNVSLSGRH
ncbi:unnamed protein product [Heligmosomoides polygyrus]|uniref:ANF_receptor domain-containing protein n=1 Tax=Heligmosomoides polygyrus TaxID=6339 RepID=A0A183F6D1_HELPZ|nr:unnamed protein product [Heligmosomoides polygyrus]